MGSLPQLHFFDLPAELRTAILEHVLVQGEIEYPCGPLTEDPVDPRVPQSVFLNVFLTCTQMYQEASAIFYSRNTFGIYLETRKSFFSISQEGRLFSPQGQDARRRIRSLTLQINRFGGNFEKAIAPVVSDMILCGALRDLEIRVTPAYAGGQTQWWNVTFNDYQQQSPPDPLSIFTTAPYKALFSLLADPDLDMVKFWVYKAHKPHWCPFHEPLEGAGSCYKKMEAKTKPWIKVDWQQVLKEWGSIMSITKAQ